MKLSVAIITLNEERNIRRCLTSLEGIADEIVVLDSGSTDQTREIAKQHGAKVFERTFTTFAEQKNSAVELTTGDYILNLDADESLTNELRESIRIALESSSSSIYSFNRKTSFCGKWIRHCGWYPDPKIRLWKRDHAWWTGKNPHEHVECSEGSSHKHLKGDLLHFPFLNEKEHLSKIHQYSTLAAEYAVANGTKSKVIKMIFSPIFAFLKKYFIQMGLLDGYYGWVISKNTAYSRYLKYKKIRQLWKQRTS